MPRTATRKPPQQLASINEAAARLGVTRRTVYDWINQGVITGWRVGPKLIKVDADELEKLITPVAAARRGDAA